MATATLVTSTVAKAGPDGVIPIHMAGWLIPHEALRREMLRADHALKHMDPVAHPWQAHGLKLWLTDFFIPALHTHHHSEELIVGPYFRAKGEPSPVWGDTKDHKEIMHLLDVVERQAIKLSQAAVMIQTPACTEGDRETVRAALAAMREAWRVFREDTLTHLEEEEKYWPGIYQKYGKKAADDVKSKIISTEMKAKGKAALAFQIFFGSICDGVGLNLAFKSTGYPPTPRHALHMAPWAVPGQPGFDLPWVPKVLIFPGWQKQYVQTWKALIDSCSGPENVTDVTAQGFPPAVGCCGGK